MFDPLSTQSENSCVFAKTKPRPRLCKKLRNRPTCRRSLTQRLVNWSTQWFSIWIKTQRRVGRGQKMGRAEAIQPGVTDFQRYHGLSACSVDTWEKSRLLRLKTNLETCCQKSSTQSVFLSYVVWGLGHEVFTKLRSASCWKKFGN